MSESTAKPGRAARLEPDICVIGAGAAGIAVASAAAAFGVPVVLVERDTPGGSRAASARRALIAAADRAHAVRGAAAFGVETEAPQLREAALHGHIRRSLATEAIDHSPERLTALGVQMLRGEARFVSRSTLAVGDQQIKARRFVVATGSRPDIPALAGLETITALTEDSLFALPRLPDRPIVLGGGGDAVALAQALGRLGCAVTLVAPGRILPGHDAEAAALVRRALLREGIALHEGMPPQRVETMRGGVRLVPAEAEVANETAVEGSHLVLATGRSPDIEALDLQLAGIVTDQGGIAVDKGLRTLNRRVYAIGGCAGGMARGLSGDAGETRQSGSHAGLVLRNALFRQPGRLDPHSEPRVAHSRPEVASLGLSEEQARKEHRGIRLLRWPFSDNAGARAEREGEGFVKIVADKRGRILGVTIAGSGAEEATALWSLALRQGLDVDAVSRIAYPHGAMMETAGRAALSFHTPLAARPGIRRLIGFLRRFG